MKLALGEAQAAGTTAAVPHESSIHAPLARAQRLQCYGFPART